MIEHEQEYISKLLTIFRTKDAGVIRAMTGMIDCYLKVPWAAEPQPAQPAEKRAGEDLGYFKQVLEAIKPSRKDILPIMNAWVDFWVGRKGRLQNGIDPECAKERLAVLKRAGVEVEAILEAEIGTYRYQAKEEGKMLRSGIVQKGKYKGQHYKSSGLKSIKKRFEYFNGVVGIYREALHHIRTIEEQEREKYAGKYPFRVI